MNKGKEPGRAEVPRPQAVFRYSLIHHSFLASWFPNLILLLSSTFLWVQGSDEYSD
jgi:hypothetical protein